MGALYACAQSNNMENSMENNLVTINPVNPKRLLKPEDLPKILKQIEGKEDLAPHFAGSLEDVSNTSLISFVKELKAAPPEIQDATMLVVGKKQIIEHNGNWLNICTNEVVKIEHAVATSPIASPPPPPGAPPATNVIPPSPVQGQGGKRIPPPPPPPSIKNNPQKNPNLDPNAKKVIFKNMQGPGDIVMLTAAVRDLHKSHPNKYVTDVRTTSFPIWESNPYITSLDENAEDVTLYELGYPLIQKSNQGPYHFSEAFTEEIESKLEISIKHRIGKGDIHIGKDEPGWASVERETWFKEQGYDPECEYWVIDAGHKEDFTAKMWSSKRYQEVVDHFRGCIQFVQIGHQAHVHPPLEGVINLIGKTDDRQLIRIIWGSSGVLSPVSYPMVLAAAIPVRQGRCYGMVERPCVVIAGGREPSRWQAHTTHQFIHTCGALPCCQDGGCWKSRTYPIGDGDEKDVKNLCLNAVEADGTQMPYCMDMITVEDVARRIELYLDFFKEDRKPTFTHNKQ
jgi:ADP-heptose:LPS heptosyltransferase